MTDVREINGLDELAQLRQPWQALLERTPWASFFLTLDWLEIYWRHFGQGQKLRVLVVSNDNEPTGILPLVVAPERTRIGRMRMLTYPLHDWGSFYGPIGPDPRETLAAGLQYLGATRRDWDAIELRWCGGAASDLGETGAAMRAAGLQACRTVWDRTAVVDLNEGWEAYLAQRPQKWRHNLRRLERRIAGRGQLDYVRYRPRGQSHGDADPRWDLYDTCEELARRSWQGSSTTGTTLCHDSVRAYLRETHQAGARLGAVDLNLLLLDGRPLAYLYGYHWQGTGYALRMGYDPEAADEGPGTLLFARLLQDSCRRGEYFYDLGAGSLRIKRYLMTRLAPIYRYGHYPLAVPRAQVLRLRRWFQQRQASGADSGTRAE